MPEFKLVFDSPYLAGDTRHGSRAIGDPSNVRMVGSGWAPFEVVFIQNWKVVGTGSTLKAEGTVTADAQGKFSLFASNPVTNPPYEPGAEYAVFAQPQSGPSVFGGSFHIRTDTTGGGGGGEPTIPIGGSTPPSCPAGYHADYVAGEWTCVRDSTGGGGGGGDTGGGGGGDTGGGGGGADGSLCGLFEGLYQSLTSFLAYAQCDAQTMEELRQMRNSIVDCNDSFTRAGYDQLLARFNQLKSRCSTSGGGGGGGDQGGGGDTGGGDTGGGDTGGGDQGGAAPASKTWLWLAAAVAAWLLMRKKG